MNNKTVPTLDELRSVVGLAHTALASLIGRFPDNLSADTAFALGCAVGALSRVRRAIDADIVNRGT